MVNLKQLVAPNSSKNDMARLNNGGPESQPEKWGLQRSAWQLILWLIFLLLFSIAFLVWGLAEVPATTLLLIGLCTAAGLCGSTIAVLISLAERLSNGWELESGHKVPENAKKNEMFGRRMVPWFVIRPFLGAVMGLAIYLGLSGGLFVISSPVNPTNLEPSAIRLTFIALIAGLFAKSFLESLKRAFAAFVGDIK